MVFPKTNTIVAQHHLAEDPNGSADLGRLLPLSVLVSMFSLSESISTT